MLLKNKGQQPVKHILELLHFCIFALLQFSTSACISWKGPSKLYKVDLSISLFSTKSNLIDTFSSLSSLSSAKSISFSKRESFVYFDFFNFFKNSLSIFSSENKTLFGSVFKLVNMFFAYCSNFLSSIFSFQSKMISTV